MRATIAMQLQPALCEYREMTLRAAGELLPQPAVAAALAKGAAMTPAEAARFALGELRRQVPRPPA